ncbi:hypothetical protein [Paraburkholderia acidipaludis]|uniref:hypothetical protein n=1 Tax=Paraburkholderia acidipaludis TaxID=660537 RepID=UPI000B065421|nr:hypothetical protein [Paraburkholderia acidipaludis]
MTSSIGPISNPFPNTLNPTTGGHATKNSNTAGNADTSSGQPETVQPTPPAGPLGHNINTTA